ncbi:Flotillin-like protein 1 [Fulvia fulva]|uniref:Flotillin-like protein 1 n=1 Tax=Passalora fulva TaxID=5499 RepID=A0A9Q8PG24_PASFU|nr:Flotillin-like protein 1 [Fulvia fulva]KAK4613369.1 Flotillin-like protein 1 [Fulvia fulva]KAK4615188.1 Flotillin-like protein 1 [Fulvia fulva]UJO21823.1 Flotillin-like protein 1 [Fulvia fulva]WPV20028.1 Flotillin-like protein 1 [Fulvia fulva]WPV35361.1 Flotillin-like protein 1 [Fulvia fulva]
MGMWYHVSEPNSYLVVTGAGIERVRLAKKCFVYPMQKVTKISITPFDFSMSLLAMTSEKLQFSLPAVFTIGPEDAMESLTKYAVLLTGDSDGQASTGKRGMVGTGRSHVQDIVKGIIEGETRSIVSNMTMEELFNNRRLFKAQVIDCVQKELDQFGLKIYNANIKELQDTGDSKYFDSLARKAHEGAQSQAQVDVANARMIGRVGEAEKEGEAKQKIAKINAHTAVLETERKVEKANADQKLKTREIEIARAINLEQIGAQRAAEQRDAELQKDVETQRAQMELARLRATTVTQAKIAKESAQEKADADLYTQTKKADAQQYNQEAEAKATYYRSQQDTDAANYKRTKDAEAMLLARAKEADAMYMMKEREAQANYFQKEREAEAAYIARKREADGLMDMAKAYGALSDVMGGPQGLMQFLMLQNGTYERLAEQNAKAIHGLQPKINVWTTGGENGGADQSMAPIQNLFKSLPPLFSTIQDQTGMTPPSWMANMPKGENEVPKDGKSERRGKALTNGRK